MRRFNLLADATATMKASLASFDNPISYLVLVIFMSWLYYLGVRLRNPTYFRVLKSLRASDFSDAQNLHDLQTKKLKELLLFAEKYSPYYSRIFRQSSYSPSLGFSGLSDLSALPVISKGELMQYAEDIHTIKHWKFKKLFFAETSGSTGQPLTFIKDEEWDSANRATIARGLSWYGVDPSARNGYLWGFSFSSIGKLKVAVLDALQNRFRLFSYEDSNIKRFLANASRAEYLHGYSSVLNEVAKLANSQGVRFTNIKVVKGTSEKIYPSYVQESLDAFGVPMISEYGAAETGIIAFECPHGKMHVNEEGVILEEIDGEAVVTNLYARSFPIIRYRLGDAIRFSDNGCTCGRSSRVLADVLGRVGKNIIGRSGKKFPSLTFYYVCKNIALRYGVMMSYQAVQREVGVVELYILKGVVDVNICSIAKIEAFSYFGEEVDVDVVLCDKLHSEGGKLKDFVTYID